MEEEKDNEALGIGLAIGFLILFFVIAGSITGADFTEGLVPLFQCLIPYLLFVGAPLVITVVIVILVKITMTGMKLTKSTVKGILPHKESTIPVKDSVGAMNARHRRKGA